MGKTNAQIDKQHESIRYALEWYTEAFRRKLEADAELDRAWYTEAFRRKLEADAELDRVSSALLRW